MEGLERRPAIFAAAPASKRFIIDTGNLVQNNLEQDIIKFQTIVQALTILNYDMVNLTEKDAEIAQNLGLLTSPGQSVLRNAITAFQTPDVNLPQKFTKRFTSGGRKIDITVASYNGKTDSAASLENLFPPPSPQIDSINILILADCDADLLETITENKIADCVICPAESDEPTIKNNTDAVPLIITAGRLGKYIVRLDIKSAAPAEKLKLTFAPVPLNENLPNDKTLTRLYETYQQLVKQANLLEKLPRFSLPNDLKYVGSESCKSCHQYEYDKWSTKSHAIAYATLEKTGTQYDPECVICHVIGLEYQSGFVSEKTTPNLKDVGCENCHGPGSEHNKTLGKMPTADPKSDCSDCHTPENSANYAGNEKIYFEKIIHWREPNTADNVKN